MHIDRFSKGAERLSDPVTAGSIHFLQQFFGLLPRPLQRRVLERSAGATPYMGFVVDPYATFLLFEIADMECAARLLPEGFRLAKTRAFEGDEPAHHAILSFFRVHTSAFIGARAEFYLMAEDVRTGLLSWVIVDYLSDTVSYDRKHGLRGPSAPHAVVTTTFDGRVMVDLADRAGEREVAFDVSLSERVMRPLDRRLWVEGNLSVAYGPDLSPGDAGVFSLTFPPDAMSKTLELPLSSLRLGRMTWHDELLASSPSRIVCFPFAQHLLSDSPGSSSRYASEADLRRTIDAIEIESLDTFSVASTKRGIVVGSTLSLVVTIVLTLAVVLT